MISPVKTIQHSLLLAGPALQFCKISQGAIYNYATLSLLSTAASNALSLATMVGCPVNCSSVEVPDTGMVLSERAC